MGWLREAPRCQCEDGTVWVTVELNPSEVSSERRYLHWRAGGLEACTPPANGLSLTYRMPKEVFQRGTVVELTLLPADPPHQVVMPWTRFPDLGQAMFRAEWVAASPVLRPVGRDRKSAQSLAG